MSLRSSGVAFLAAGCLAAAVPLPAQPSEQAQQAGATAAPRRPKIGLALGGGGARGFAHIGVLRALESLHIQIDYIAGTSMGSVVGSLYATGYSTDQIEAIVEKIPWATVFIDEPERQKLSFRNKEDDFLHLLPLQFGIKKGGLALPPGLVAGNKLSFVLESVLLPSESAPDFAHLRIPFKAVATDVQTGVPVVLSKGSLAHSVRASMAVPAVFTPVEIDGKLLVDGGESENLPVQTVRAMGADIVIAIDVGASGEASKAPENVAQMIGAIIDIPLKQNTDASRKLADLVIQPDLRGYTSADFLKYAELIPKGQEAAMRASAELTRWSEPAAAFDAWRAAKEAPFPPAPVIDAVEVAPVPGFDQDRLTRLVKSQPGRPLDFKVLAKDMHRIYAIGAFSIVSYDVVEEGGRRILRITAIPKTWGPTFVRPGLGLESDGKSNTAFDVDLLVDATEMNRLGGRWKTLLDVGSNLGISSVFYQPVEATGTFSLAPNVQWSQHTQSIYAAEEQVARYLVRRFNGGLDLVADFGTWGELRAGYQGGTGNATRQVGIGLLPDIHADFGAIGARFDVDQLDNVNVPRVGYLSRVRFEAQRPGLGASASYDKLEGEALGVQTLGRWSGLLKVAGGDGLGTTLPYYQTFPLGGLFRLSGRPQDQLRGQTYLLGAALLYYRLNRTSGLIIKDLYLGVSAEAGNTWDLRKNVSLSDLRTSGSVFVAVNSLIGPVYIAWGHASGGSNALYFALNRSF